MGPGSSLSAAKLGSSSGSPSDSAGLATGRAARDGPPGEGSMRGDTTRSRSSMPPPRPIQPDGTEGGPAPRGGYRLRAVVRRAPAAERPASSPGRTAPASHWTTIGGVRGTLASRAFRATAAATTMAARSSSIEHEAGVWCTAAPARGRRRPVRVDRPGARHCERTRPSRSARRSLSPGGCEGQVEGIGGAGAGHRVVAPADASKPPLDAPLSPHKGEPAATEGGFPDGRRYSDALSGVSSTLVSPFGAGAGGGAVDRERRRTDAVVGSHKLQWAALRVRGGQRPRFRRVSPSLPSLGCSWIGRGPWPRARSHGFDHDPAARHPPGVGDGHRRQRGLAPPQLPRGPEAPALRAVAAEHAERRPQDPARASTRTGAVLGDAIVASDDWARWGWSRGSTRLPSSLAQAACRTG